MAARQPDSDALQDGQLVRSTLRGELPAFDQLVRRYQRRAAAVAYRLLNNRDDALEVSQDAFLKAYDKLGSLSQPDRFGSWLLRIVSNLALNRRRARALRKASSIDAETSDSDRNDMNLPDAHVEQPDELVSGEETRKMISRMIDQLPEMQRQALVLFSVEKLPQKQVAEILGCSVEAVKWHVFTARKKLKDQLRDYL